MKTLFSMLIVLAISIPLAAGAADKTKKEPDIQAGKPDKETCDSLSKAFDFGDRVIAMATLSALGDNSAPRETVRKLEINNQLLIKGMNLSLMVQYKCPLPKEIDSSAKYQADAVHCIGAQIKGDLKSTECDMKNWKGASNKGLPTQNSD